MRWPGAGYVKVMRWEESRRSITQTQRRLKLRPWAADSSRIWGTNVSVIDTLSTFKGFLNNSTKKYRMRLDGMSEKEIKRRARTASSTWR